MSIGANILDQVRVETVRAFPADAAEAMMSDPNHPEMRAMLGARTGDYVYFIPPDESGDPRGPIRLRGEVFSADGGTNDRRFSIYPDRPSALARLWARCSNSPAKTLLHFTIVDR